MKLTSFAIQRPVATTAFIILFIIAGINSYRSLGLENLPEVSPPFVTITTIYPGANPKEIEASVARKIEDTVSTISGLKHVYSTCMQNICQTILEFQLEMDIDVAAMDVRERINLITDDLPANTEAPKILKIDINAKPIATLALVGDRPLDQLYDYADDILSSKLSVVPGVAQVEVAGGEKLEVHITLDREKLSSHNLTVAQVIDLLQIRNIKAAAGTLSSKGREVSVTFDGEFQNIQEIEDLEISTTKLAKIRIGDIAKVSIRAKEKRSKAFYNGKPAINLKIIKKGEANAVAVVKRVKKLVNKITKTLPGRMELIWFNDDGSFIEASVIDARNNIFLGILLTALILFIFLHEIRSVLIISLTMPVTVVISLFFMKIFGFTLNMITLLALGTSVGILVANSIVVIEHIFQKLEEGESPKKAAVAGTNSVLVAVVASAGTNMIVFIPIAVMPGLVGRFFYPFAISMAIVTVASLFVSFTLTPILAARFLRRDMAKQGFFGRYWDIGYRKVVKLHATTLRFCARAPLFFLSLVVAILIFTLVYIAPLVGMSFFPNNDRGEFLVKLEYPTSYNIDKSLYKTLAASGQIRNLPEVLSTSTLVGKIQGVMGKVNEGVYLAEIMVKTTQKNQRTRTMAEVRDLLRKEFINYTDCLVSVNVPSVVGGSETDIELEVTGDSLKKLDQLGLQIKKIAQKSGMLIDIDVTTRVGKTEIRVLPNRPILTDAKISERFLGLVLRGNIEGIKVGTYEYQARQLDIRVILQRKEGLKQLSEFTLMANRGKPLSLETVASFRTQKIPIQIVRADKRRSVKLFANVAPGAALSDAIDYLNQKISATLPFGYELNYVGRVEKMGEAQQAFAEAFLTAALLLYLLIAAVMESWKQPFIILTTLPMALIGLFTMLFVTGHTMSMMGLLGTMILIGIAVNDAILIMENVKMLRTTGVSAKEAMFTSVSEKFRSVIMTSIAAVMGIAPMAFGSGLGCEIRNSCGVTVIGGLISSTIFTLYVIPLIYIRFVAHKEQ